MKIKQVHVRASKIKLKETFTIALGTIESADSAIVEIETEEGLVGYGEGGPGILLPVKRWLARLKRSNYLPSNHWLKPL